LIKVHIYTRKRVTHFAISIQATSSTGSIISSIVGA